jgi:hypothetical protein
MEPACLEGLYIGKTILLPEKARSISPQASFVPRDWAGIIIGCGKASEKQIVKP